MLIQTPRTPKSDFRSHARTVAITAAWIVSMLALAVTTIVFMKVAVDEAGNAEPATRVAPAQPVSPTGEVDQSGIGRIERLDHSGVAARSTAHDSDEPGASIAAYGP